MKKLDEILKNKKPFIVITVTAVVGVCLLLFANVGGGEAESDGTEYQSVVSYTEKLEDRVKAICLAVDGVDDVTVLLTLESGSEYIYADNVTEDKHSDSSWGYTSDYLIIEKGDGTAPVPVMEIYPKVRGVAVVCNGGDGAVLQKKLTELISAALGIPSSRIKISA